MDRELEEARRRGFERFLLFTDAVVAIAVTLLILPIVDDVLRPDDPDRRVTDLLGGIAGEIFGFLLSFAVIVVLWMGHQQVFAIAAAPTSWLVRLNVGWLLSIILLPCTTALIADHGDEQVTVLLYIGNVALSIYCLAASTWLLARRPGLLLAGATISRDDRHDAILYSALVTLAFIVAAVLPGLSFSALLVLFLAEPLTWLWKRFQPAT